MPNSNRQAEQIQLLVVDASNQQQWLDQVIAIEQLSNQTPWQQQHFLTALDAGNYLLIITSNSQVLGYCLALHGFEEVHLLNIAIHPDFRGQSLASTLIQQLIAWSLLQSCQKIFLEVRISNLAAIALYKKIGFSEIARRKDYYATADKQREDALVMLLNLPNYHWQ